MSTIDLTSASSISEGLASGEFSVREVALAVNDAISKRDDVVRAFLHHDPEQLLADADSLDRYRARGEALGPLFGVPVALKDNMVTISMPTTCGSKILEGWVPPYDATVVERLRGAGALIVGKTNLDEFAMGSSTENSAYFTTRNPHDPTRVPGGSSGGSAAAVAAGYVPLALGSDTGGSIRQPAALCGVVGVKPTYGAVSRYGLIAFASSLDQIGPFSHSVADAAFSLEVISGHDRRDSTSLHQPPMELRSTAKRGVAGLRIGVVSELIEMCAPDVVAKTQAAADALRAAGAEVEVVSVPAVTFGLSAYYLIAPAEASSNLARFDGVRFGLRAEGADITEMYLKTRAEGFGPEVKRRIMLGTYALSAGYYDAYYGKALKVRRRIAESFDDVYRNFDVLLSPTSPTTAFKIGEKAADPLTMYLNDVCTIPSNLAGHPAVSVPYGVGTDGLPVGVQILGPALSEPTLFAVAFELERAATADKEGRHS
ncbi:MAG: Asp-tRNA(Asn)/Glu-tRNA(Gln) amidotransferase subunit GatA [Acidimicrobiales bacterium]